MRLASWPGCSTSRRLSTYSAPRLAGSQALRRTQAKALKARSLPRLCYHRGMRLPSLLTLLLAGLLLLAPAAQAAPSQGAKSIARALNKLDRVSLAAQPAAQTASQAHAQQVYAGCKPALDRLVAKNDFESRFTVLIVYSLSAAHPYAKAIHPAYQRAKKSVLASKPREKALRAFAKEFTLESRGLRQYATAFPIKDFCAELNQWAASDFYLNQIPDSFNATGDLLDSQQSGAQRLKTYKAAASYLRRAGLKARLAAQLRKGYSTTDLPQDFFAQDPVMAMLSQDG